MFQSAFYSDLHATNFDSTTYVAARGNGPMLRLGSFARLLQWGRNLIVQDEIRGLNAHLRRDIGVEGF